MCQAQREQKSTETHVDAQNLARACKSVVVITAHRLDLSVSWSFITMFHTSPLPTHKNRVDVLLVAFYLSYYDFFFCHWFAENPAQR